MRNFSFQKTVWLFAGAWTFAFFLLAGCAPLLVAGGAVGGYAVAKDMDDGKLIDDKKAK